MEEFTPKRLSKGSALLREEPRGKDYKVNTQNSDFQSSSLVNEKKNEECTIEIDKEDLRRSLRILRIFYSQRRNTEALTTEPTKETNIERSQRRLNLMKG